ncbi:MAG: endonuclease V [Planctomycetaceae bacterium]|nr:endonuclease V [Planctomycetaceae bacterium]
MHLAMDVHYRDDNSACVAGILFREWDSEAEESTLVCQIDQVAEYEPGNFYKRELPCLQTLLATVTCPLQTIIIDGFVTLGATGRPGLGFHLYEQLTVKTPVIGVAKNKFVDTSDETRIYRGNSGNPLYITARGLPLETARQRIMSMHGDFRIPTLLRRVDQLCRAGG